MDRRAEHNAVSLLDQRQHLGYRPPKDTAAGLAAAAAAHTAAHRGRPDVEDRGLDTGFIQRFGHLGQRRVCAAVLVRAAVDK